jgi:hypothetical protein
VFGPRRHTLVSLPNEVDVAAARLAWQEEMTANVHVPFIVLVLAWAVFLVLDRIAEFLTHGTVGIRLSPKIPLLFHSVNTRKMI